MPTRLDRRALLRTTGLTGAGLLLAACAGTPDPAAAPDADGGTATPAGDLPSNNEDIAARALDVAGVDAPVGLTPIIAAFELLTGTGRVPFGVLDEQQRPILDGDVTVWVVDQDGALAAGPVTPVFFGEGLGARGVYIAELELPEPGIHDLVVRAETPDGPRAGTGALSVVDPASSTTYPPGTELPVVSTPTVDDQGPLEELCTLEPDCSMHDTDLAEVHGSRPVVLSIATPAYCQTAVCGPVIEVVERVRADLGRDDVVFIHAEVYNDAAVTPAPHTQELGLPSEPWTWVLDADGVVVDRFDGPVVPELLRAAIDQV